MTGIDPDPLHLRAHEAMVGGRVALVVVVVSASTPCSRAHGCRVLAVGVEVAPRSRCAVAWP